MKNTVLEYLKTPGGVGVSDSYPVENPYVHVNFPFLQKREPTMVPKVAKGKPKRATMEQNTNLGGLGVSWAAFGASWAAFDQRGMNH